MQNRTQLAPQEALAITANLLSLSKQFVEESMFSFTSKKTSAADDIRRPIAELHEQVKNKTLPENKKVENPLTLSVKQSIREYLTDSMNEKDRLHLTQLFDQLDKLCAMAFSTHEELCAKNKTPTTLALLEKARESFTAEIDSAIRDNTKPEVISGLTAFKTSFTYNMNQMITRYQLMDKEKLIREKDAEISRLSFETSLATQESKVVQTERQQNKEKITQLEQLNANLSKRVAELEKTNKQLMSEPKRSVNPPPAQPKSTPWFKYAMYTAGVLLGGALIATGLGAPIGVSLAMAAIIAGSAMTGSGLLYGVYRAFKNCFTSQPADDAPDHDHDRSIAQKHTPDNESTPHSTSSAAIRSTLQFDVYDETESSRSTNDHSDSPSSTFSRPFKSPRTVDTYKPQDEFVSAADLRSFT